MPRYISLHTLGCLTRQGAEQLTARLAAAERVTARRVQVNMTEGKMLVEFEAADRDTLEKWFRDEGFHYDWVMRIEFEARGGKLEPV
jgi:isopentenyl diphosphate isomerase/L-lactate dehydrogenase-like FMN-dependent dehydrogenase